MRKLWVVAVSVNGLMSVGAAQQKMESKWHCGKVSTENSVEVGDVAGHSYGIEQGDCQATSSSTGEKTGKFTEFVEAWKSRVSTRGQFNVTYDNGDTITHSYTAEADLAKKTVQEKWKVVSGTGKHKGATGAGTCSGKLNDDGTSDWECSGTISTGK